MEENFSFLFQYLKKENVTIDQNEFVFQAQSHPDYPSLLAFSDTLHFFNIQNGAIRVTASEIIDLPDRFVSLLKEEGDKPQLYFIEKRGGDFFCAKDNKWEIISNSTLESRWEEIILLVEKSETDNETTIPKNKLIWGIPLLCLCLFIVKVIQFEETIQTKLFFLFPVLGFLFSIAALKDLFGTKSKLLNDFCNISESTSCTTLINSDKWKILKLINFSDLSIIFFSSQFISLFLFIFSGNSNDFFAIQNLLLFCSAPIILLSLYYQKVVEEKWCPICLAIIGILVFELMYTNFILNSVFYVSFQSIILYVLIYLFIASVWSVLKKVLTQQKELKEYQMESNRFKRNYENFRKVLVSNDKTELAHSPIILGNKDSKTEITIITSPFCGYCKDAHEILEKILIKYKSNIKVKVLINADIDSIDEEKKTFFRILMSIYVEKGEAPFLKALDYWFNNKNIEDWIFNFNSPYDSEKMDSIYKLQNQWCVVNNSYLTPSIFINGYRYPKSYKREDLTFFINELVEDTF